MPDRVLGSGTCAVLLSEAWISSSVMSIEGDRCVRLKHPAQVSTKGGIASLVAARLRETPRRRVCPRGPIGTRRPSCCNQWGRLKPSCMQSLLVTVVVHRLLAFY